jgi:hypothetical protein
VAAPFLGAPKSLRSCISGDRVGLEAFLSHRDGLTLSRSLGSPGCLLPRGSSAVWHGPEQPPAFVFLTEKPSAFATASTVVTSGVASLLHTSSSLFGASGLFKAQGASTSLAIAVGKTSRAITDASVGTDWRSALVYAGGTALLHAFESWYFKNPLFGDGPQSASVSCPPVDRLYHIFGTNLDTECAYYYRPTEQALEIDSRVITCPWPAYVCREGIVYETRNSPQPWAPLRDREVHCASGDGTVPYASLAHCRTWAGELDLKVDELEGAEHRSILSNRMFFEKVVQYLCSRHS